MRWMVESRRALRWAHKAGDLHRSDFRVEVLCYRFRDRDALGVPPLLVRIPIIREGLS